MNHTPGPWQIGQMHSHGAKVTNGHVTVAWCGANGTYSNDYAYVIDGNEAAANATLIAEAPNLLKELTTAIKFLEVLCGNIDELANSVIADGKAAIAKARGEK